MAGQDDPGKDRSSSRTHIANTPPGAQITLDVGAPLAHRRAYLMLRITLAQQGGTRCASGIV